MGAESPVPSGSVAWLRVARAEPSPGAEDVALGVSATGEQYGFGDERGDVPHDWIDITELAIQRMSTTSEGIGMALRYGLVSGVGAAPHSAYGVVLDTNCDGVGDYMIGMDNDSPTQLRHAEWIADLATSEVSINPSPTSFGHGAFGTFVDSWMPGESGSFGNRIIVGRQPQTGERSIRFYFWASSAVDDEVVTDYAPDSGWITYVPDNSEIQP